MNWRLRIHNALLNASSTKLKVRFAVWLMSAGLLYGLGYYHASAKRAHHIDELKYTLAQQSTLLAEAKSVAAKGLAKPHALTLTNPTASQTKPLDVAVNVEANAGSKTILQDKADVNKNAHLAAIDTASLPPQAALNTMIDIAGENTVEHYYRQFFSEQDAQYIGDKKQFAKQLSEAYFDKQEDVFNKDTAFPPSAITFSISRAGKSGRSDFALGGGRPALKKMRIYAHWQLDSNAYEHTKVFVKWRHLDSGKVMVFNQSNINMQSTDNWVSYKPTAAWPAGRYQVNVYQLNDRLSPIAQGHYTVSY